MDGRLERIDVLKAKLKAREGKPGYAKNCEELRAAIAQHEARLPENTE